MPATRIRGRQLADGAVGTAKLADGAVTAPKLADLAVTNAKLALLAVASGNLVDNAVTQAKVLDGAISTSKLADTCVTEAKLASSSVTEAKLGPGAVTTAKLATSCVTFDRLSLAATPAIEDGGSGAVRVKVDGSTVRRGASGLAVLESGLLSPILFKNRLINPTFDLWQRRGSARSRVLASAVDYVADRWITSSGSGGTCTVSAVAMPPGQTVVPGEPRWHFRHAQSVAAADTPYLVQRIEDVRTFAGQPFTFSFWASADADGRQVQVGHNQGFGSGGSAGVAGAQATVTLTTAWQRHSVTITPASIAGKTVGAGSLMEVFILLPSGVTFTFDMALPQVEAGAVATEFDRRPDTIELLLCQRYYFKTYEHDNAPGSATPLGEFRYVAPSAAGEAAPVCIYPATTRTLPTLTFYSPNSGTSGKRYNYSTGADETQTGVNTTGTRLHSGGPGHASGQLYGYHCVGSAEL